MDQPCGGEDGVLPDFGELGKEGSAVSEKSGEGDCAGDDGLHATGWIQKTSDRDLGDVSGSWQRTNFQSSIFNYQLSTKEENHYRLALSGD